MSASVADMVRAEIEEAILSGRLPAGGRVNADDHARRMGVSHIPVREALRALQADGWIVQRRNQGAFVRDRDPRDLADLFEARLHLEGDIAVLAAHRRTAAQLDELDRILDRQASVGDPGERARINAEFHVCLAACSQNAVLTGYLRDLSKRVRFYFLPTAAMRRADSLAEHRAIVDALRRRDGETAQSLVRAHVADTRDDAARAMTTPDRQGRDGHVHELRS
ncbi:MAG TPA: GntR family transcriptional regulator [Pseudonocardiaceae bacterium]|nr:GntR family transcriptional regulator [Pseudonocardiaceae bacterium]